MDRMIRLLLIEDDLILRERGPGHMHDDAVGMVGGVGHAGLHMVRTQGLEDATAHLRHERFDAILLNRDDVDGNAIAWLQARAADLPILVVQRHADADLVQRVIGQGVEDVLLPEELAAGHLRRRIDLAIARKSFEAIRARHAWHDPLTGLATRALVEERFIRALARADRSATLVGLVAIDLDGVDRLIARHDRSAPDRLLPMVSQRLFEETRQTDTLARTRDHGFTLLVEGLTAIGDINALVNRLPLQLAAPFLLDGQKIDVTASVGVAICPIHGRDFKAVHSMAEAAMLDVATISGDALLMLPVPSTRSVALT